MISKVAASSAAYTQQIASHVENKDAKPVAKPKELDKVESLKEQIKGGEYKFDLLKTAQAIVRDLV
ncbi:MAG: flagellar biosynthesis anti-sigma factor FlgM [Sulfurospirillum sp.]|nr:flagellar biosynthesis anti-sigma factor FlgM [Sulfurospirillum sp.]